MDTTAPFVLSVETPESRTLRITLDDPLAADPPVDAAAVRLWEAAPGLAATDIPLDSMDLDDVRSRRIAIAAVERRGANELQVVPAEPLRKDRVYRVELAVENASGLPAEPEGGRTFRPRYEGPAVWPAERVPWEEPDAPPPAPPPEREDR